MFQAESAHTTLSEEHGHEPPVPVSWMIRPMRSIFTSKLLRTLSGHMYDSESNEL